MPLCSSGISQPIPGAASTVILTGQVLQGLFPAGAWIIGLLGAITGLTTLDLPTFCAVDPPADPGVTGQDVADLITLGPGPLTAAATARVEQLVQRYAWYSFCQCATVATPAPPTFPSPPSGLPALNPPGLTGVPIPPCSVETYQRSVDSNTLLRLDMPSNTPCDGGGQPTCGSLRRSIPTGAVAVQYWYTADLAGAFDTNSAHTWSVIIRWYTGATQTGNVSISVKDYGSFQTINSGWHSNIEPIPAGVDGYEIAAESNTGLVWNAGTSVNWLCSTGTNINPGGGACCTATDPTTLGMMQQILQMVTLLQRQSTPFAYIPGTIHSGLSGTGTLAVQGILGVLLNVSIPGRAGEISGTPDTRFSVGWINFGTADGYAERTFIESDSQVVFPVVAGAWTIVAYTLLAGVTATITELIREA